jgi:hypothetical protein
MKSIKTAIAMSAMAGGAAWSGVSFAANDGNNAAHAVFVMTNNADSNQVIAFQRDPNGALENPHSYGTAGRGSGGTVDPLASQGSLTLSADHAWLFAVNAGTLPAAAASLDSILITASWFGSPIPCASSAATPSHPVQSRSARTGSS